MNYQRVCLEALGYTLPRQVVTTDEIEHRLAPVYERLRLPHGRLELMTGIRERRFFQSDTLPGQVSLTSGEQAIQVADIERHHIGALVHGSVCRDYLEPATACSVHHGLGLTQDCLIYDVSNACLGILTGMIQVANMIELGQIRAGLIVGTESGRQLVDNTIERLNTDQSLNRQNIKNLIASLTIGSGSVAVLLCDEELSRTKNRLTTATVLANTDHHALCRSAGMETFMHTDSEQLMNAGVATGAETFTRFLDQAKWQRGDIDKTICHQVGVAHRKLLFESLGLDTGLDYSTFETLGNTGAAALPLTLALAVEAGHIQKGDRVAMLGIGSGINCQMLALEWRKSLVRGGIEAAVTEDAPACG
ncbi:MAG: 3-oxoacyl-ACP synthase III [Bythopirellula sp.]|nr:3-oxoacyl-ACP synthase III [Bythopirellula sp.]